MYAGHGKLMEIAGAKPRDRVCYPWGVFALSCLAFCSTPVSRWEASADPRHRLGKPFPYFQIFSGGVGAPPEPLDWGIVMPFFVAVAQDPKEVGGAETGDEWEDPFLCCAAESDLGEDAHARSTLQGRGAGGSTACCGGIPRKKLCWSWHPWISKKMVASCFIGIQGRDARYILCPYRSRHIKCKEMYQQSGLWQSRAYWTI